MTPALPLPTLPLIDRSDGAPLFHRPQGPVSAAAFLHDAHEAAAALPPGGHIVNLCRDRYAFAVAFAAGLIARRTSLLNLPLHAIATRYPGCAAITDEPLPGCTLPTLLIRPAACSTSTPDACGASTRNPAIPADHLAAIVFTSGSTGTPVGHDKRWGELVARTRAAARQFAIAGGSIIPMVPPQHMYGFETTILLPLHAPVATWCGPAFFPADVAAAMRPCPGPRILVTTPLQLRTLLSTGIHLPGITAISATAPLDLELAAEIEQRWGGPVLEIFGATECGSIASRRPAEHPDWTPYPGIRLLIEPDGTTVLAEAAEPVALGDLLESIPDGFRLLGRRTDLVKLAGRRASLLGLNQALVTLPGVDDGVFLVPDDLDQRTTARLLAIVVAPNRTAPSILADLRRVIDPVFLPRRVIRVDTLPRNAMGKLPRQALLDLVAKAP